MTNKHRIVIIAILLLPRIACADGFKLKLDANKIVGKNNVNLTPDHLFGHNFDFTNNQDGTYESSHGSVDANDAGSGFNFPAGAPNDSFTYNIQGLWTYSGGMAVPASPSMTLDILKASDGTPLAHIDGPVATPPRFTITATTTHELIWSVPQSSTTDIWGLVYTITGNSVISGLPYEESDPFVAVQWTPQFQGDENTAMQAIYAAATRIPGDYDGDSEVAANDYQIWKAHFGETVTPFASADGNGDGLIDAADYIVWRDHATVSGSVTSAAAAAGVPEPAGLIVAAMGGILLATRRRRKMSKRATLRHR